MKKILSIIIVIVMACLCLVGCKPTVDDNTIRLNEVTHSVFYAPLYIAIDKGYFEEENLKIELTNGGGADKSMTAVMSGQADIGLMGPEAAVYVKLNGSNNYPVVFGQLTKRDGSFLIGRKPEPDFKWTNLKGKEILGGRKNGMPAMSLEYALKRNNLVLDKDVIMNYDVQYDMIIPAFESGSGDYCTMFEPSASAYVAAGKGNIVASVGAEAGIMPYTCFMATKTYIAENTEKVTRFMRAIIKGIDFIKSNNSTVIAEAIKKSFPATSVEILAASIDSYKNIGAYMTSPVLDEDNFNTLLDVLMSAKAISSKDVKYSDIVDNTIAKSLL